MSQNSGGGSKPAWKERSSWSDMPWWEKGLSIVSPAYGAAALTRNMNNQGMFDGMKSGYEDVNAQYSDPTWNTMSALADPNGQAAQRAYMDQGDYARSQFFDPGGFKDQAYAATMDPTSQFYSGQQALAQRGAQQGIDQAGTQMAGLGGLYSGAMMDAGNRAAQDAMLQATNATNQFSSNMLNNMWQQGLAGSYGAAGNMAGIGAGLYGQGIQGMGQMGNPMYEYQPGMWDKFMQGGQLAMQALPLMV